MGNHSGILRVNGRAVKTPSSMTWGFQRVSAHDAGRTEDTIMHVNQVGTKRKIQLTWVNITPEDAHNILNAFAPEYLSVNYFDPMAGGYITKTFYTGDMSAPVKMFTVNKKIYESVSFDIIEV